MDELDSIHRDLQRKFPSLAKKDTAHYVLDAVMVMITEHVLDKNLPGKSRFLDEFADLHSMHFLGYSGRGQHESLGFLEDKIMMARDSAVAGGRLAMMTSADGEKAAQIAQ